MKPTRLFTGLVLISFLFSCNPQISLRSASWNTWTGGQPGVGGMKYYFTLENPKQLPFILEQVTIENQEFGENEITLQGDSINIIASERLKRVEPTVNNPNPKPPRLRSQAPEAARIIGKVKNKTIVIPVDTFTKAKAVSYQ